MDIEGRTMKFKTEDLIELSAGGTFTDLELIKSELTNHSRWSVYRP